MNAKGCAIIDYNQAKQLANERSYIEASNRFPPGINRTNVFNELKSIYLKEYYGLYPSYDRLSRHIL